MISRPCRLRCIIQTSFYHTLKLLCLRMTSCSCNHQQSPKCRHRYSPATHQDNMSSIYVLNGVIFIELYTLLMPAPHKLHILVTHPIWRALTNVLACDEQVSKKMTHWEGHNMYAPVMLLLILGVLSDHVKYRLLY